MVVHHDADAAAAGNQARRRMVGRDGRSISPGVKRIYVVCETALRFVVDVCQAET
jgi:hypothetical protein